MSARPQLIYFDVGGVLMHFYHIRNQAARRLGVPDDAFQALLRELEIGRNDGSITEQEVERRIIQRFNLTVAPGFWADVAWVEDFRPVTEMHNLAKELAEHYRVGILSNVSQAVSEKGKSIPGLWPEVVFDPLVLSFEVGLAKPDVRIFQHAIKVAGCEPSEILFIDDIEANVAAAQTAGLQTFLFHPANAAEDTEQLKNLLLTE